MQAYLAGPLFSEAEQDWLRKLKAEIEGLGIAVIWPFELIDNSAMAAMGDKAPKYIMDTDRAAVERCDIVVALLDGTQVDDGTAWEIGYAYARSIPVLGVRTDFRNGGDTTVSRVNAMIEGSCLAIAGSRQELLERLSALLSSEVR